MKRKKKYNKRYDSDDSSKDRQTERKTDRQTDRKKEQHGRWEIILSSAPSSYTSNNLISFFILYPLPTFSSMHHVTDSAFTQGSDQHPHRSHSEWLTQYTQLVIRVHVEINTYLILTLWRTHFGKRKEDEEFEHLHHSVDAWSVSTQLTSESSGFFTSLFGRILAGGKWMTCTQQSGYNSLVMSLFALFFFFFSYNMPI